MTHKYDTLLIVDEVATGFGRTGRMFACEHEDVRPDLMCVAKGLTGGYLPLAATLTTQRVFDEFLGEVAEHKTLYHGHTYTGNALGCAAAIASLELFERNSVLESLRDKIGLIRRALSEIRGLDYVGDVRQCGMMAGVEIVRDKETKAPFAYEATVGAKVCAAMRGKGAMMRPLGDVVVIMPPPAIDTATLGRLLAIIMETLQDDLPPIVKGL